MARYILKAPPLKRSHPDETEEDVDNKITSNEKKWQYYVRLILSVFALFMTLAVLFTFVFHIIMPLDLRWLSGEDLKYIKELAVTITIGLILSIVTTNFFKKH